MKDPNNISDRYIKNFLSNVFGLQAKDIPQSLIEFKREQLLFYRELKTLKKEIQNGIA